MGDTSSKEKRDNVKTAQREGVNAYQKKNKKQIEYIQGVIKK